LFDVKRSLGGVLYRLTLSAAPRRRSSRDCGDQRAWPAKANLSQLPQKFRRGLCKISPKSRPFSRAVVDPTNVNDFNAIGRFRMLRRAAGLASVIFISATVSAFAVESNPPPIKGLWLATDFPSITLHAGGDTTLPLTLYSYGLAPQRTNISIDGVPAGWKTEIDGAGKPVKAAFVDYDGKANLSLKLTIPASTKPGAYDITIKAAGEDASSDLPIAIDLAAPLAAKLTATPQLPTLKGSPHSSFDFKVSVKNDSPDDMLVNLTAGTPPGFDATFKEGYGSQELTSLPFKAGESKDVTVSIKPAPDVKAGDYPIPVEFVGDKARTATTLTLDVAGQPELSLSGQNELLSGVAYAGDETSFPLVLRNTGSASARNVTVSASEPSGWKITFTPKEFAEIPANGERKITAQVTPPAKAIDGDYMISMTASGGGLSQSVNYRVTVLTSTLWGVAGIGVIGVALLVLIGAVARFGRR
jgi:uncharacterized membrane protein